MYQLCASATGLGKLIVVSSVERQPRIYYEIDHVLPVL